MYVMANARYMCLLLHPTTAWTGLSVLVTWSTELLVNQVNLAITPQSIVCDYLIFLVEKYHTCLQIPMRACAVKDVLIVSLGSCFIDLPDGWGVYKGVRSALYVWYCTRTRHWMLPGGEEWHDNNRPVWWASIISVILFSCVAWTSILSFWLPSIWIHDILEGESMHVSISTAGPCDGEEVSDILQLCSEMIMQSQDHA